MLISASKAGRATDSRTDACAARWKTVSGLRRMIRSLTSGRRMSRRGEGEVSAGGAGAAGGGGGAGGGPAGGAPPPPRARQRAEGRRPIAPAPASDERSHRVVETCSGTRAPESRDPAATTTDGPTTVPP